MRPDPRFTEQTPEFWANVRLIGERVGYRERSQSPKLPKGQTRPKGEEKTPGRLRVPTLAQTEAAFRKLGLTVHRLDSGGGQITDLGRAVFAYFQHRADVLNGFVMPSLMTAAQAADEYTRMKRERPNRDFSGERMNKQSQDKKKPSYFSLMIQLLVDDALGGLPCDHDPQALTTITKDGAPFRTLVRRVDGAFPSPIDPLAVWEIKEYYHTTTFGSRVADGVYVSLLDGMELRELDRALREEVAEHEKRPDRIEHLLMVDAFSCWWVQGASYLCRIIDMLHMGYVDEVLFGREIFTRLPALAAGWASTYRSLPPQSSATK